MIKTNKVGVEMLQILSRNGNNAVILCRCPICGQLFSMQRSHFYRGSNGCRCRLPISERLYSIWTNIKTRCNNPNSTCSKYYYDKGITICKEWASNYKIFESWALSSGYNDSLTIDRIDNNQGYYPLNCRWVSYHKQNRNKSSNIYLVIDGVSKILKDWSVHIHIPYKTLMSFYYRHNKDETIQYIKDRIKQLGGEA